MPGTFNYDDLYSEKSSDTPIRTVTHAEYDFAVAYPAPETLPVDGLTTSLQVMLDSRPDEMARNLAYYPQALGSPELREYTSHKLMEDRGISVSPDEIMLTAGSSEAIGLLIQALTDPGDTVLTERYVYAGTLGQLQRFDADVVGVPIDDDGIIPEALSELIDDLTAAGRRPKYLYTIPEHQNPTGSTLPESRRRDILEIAHRHGMPILEDECYVDLRFEGETQPAFRMLDDSGIVIHVASYSKLVAPGLRLGYFTAQGDVMRRAANFRVGGGPSQLSAYAVEGFLRDNLDQHRARFNPVLKEKRDAMVASLEANFAGTGATWSHPLGGCYVWLTMPAGADLGAVQPACMEGGVGYVAGPAFAPNNDGDHCARLCFAFETPEKNRKGIARLAELFDDLGVMKATSVN